eukprot:Gb_07865 [translate_table: standard]
MLFDLASSMVKDPPGQPGPLREGEIIPHRSPPSSIPYEIVIPSDIHILSFECALGCLVLCLRKVKKRSCPLPLSRCFYTGPKVLITPRGLFALLLLVWWVKHFVFRALCITLLAIFSIEV